ncbi:MAG: flagellar M-ring protein FliF C-terminal domain-containing protein, partial [Rhodothermales bacterium]
LSGGSRLSPEQIEAVTQLVAGAVEGLAASDVTILDTRGNLLSNPSSGDENAMITSTQLRYQTAVENHLTEKGQTMLDQIVGPGNAIVRVSATIDFSRTVSESNTIDPESATVIAEEKMDQAGGDDSAEQSIKNYELSRTVERSESSTGQISYLTVSVILNERRAGGTETPVQEAAVTENRIPEIESLVKNAVGFNETRGDRFAIHQTSFDTSMDEQIATDMRDHQKEQQNQIYLRYGLMALALLAALFLMRSATKKVGASTDGPVYLNSALKAKGLAPGAQKRGSKVNELAAHDEEEEEEEVVMVDDFFSSRLSPEAKARLKAKHLMYEEIKKGVTDNPDNTADLLRNWILEDNLPI